MVIVGPENSSSAKSYDFGVSHNERMADNVDSISPDLARWMEQQHVFFVATAPLATTGHVNCSPKGWTRSGCWGRATSPTSI